MRKIISAGKKKQLFYEKLKGDVLKAVVCFQPFFVQNCWRKEENDCKRYDTRTFLIKNPIYRQSWDDSIESPHEYIVAAMWSLRPQVILCLKMTSRKKNDKFHNRMHGMRTIYAHEIIAKSNQQNELTKFLAFQLLDLTNSSSLR